MKTGTWLSYLVLTI